MSKYDVNYGGDLGNARILTDQESKDQENDKYGSFKASDLRNVEANLRSTRDQQHRKAWAAIGAREFWSRLGGN